MRSKASLVSNILATVYSIYLLWTFGSAINELGGADYIEAVEAYFDFAFDILGMSSPTVTFVYVILILVCVHIAAFTLGCIIGWISFIGKKSGGAKFAATLYLIGTICFPIYIFLGLPITIIAFVGGGNQKLLNSSGK